MPEGDTVFLAATRLRRALQGATITRSDLRVPRYATTDLSGRTVEDVIARGKHLLFRLGDLTLHSHFKMEGSWHLYKHGERWKGPAFQVRAILETVDAVAVGFRLAAIEVVPREREDELVGHLGPDPLGPDWDPGEAVANLTEEPARPLVDAILDQRLIAGPGNVYKCEALFLSGLYPWRTVGSVEDPAALVDLLARLLQANRETGRQITTCDGRRGRERWVYGRGGEPCRRCGTRIQRREEPGERVTYWCPYCQPLQAGGE